MSLFDKTLIRFGYIKMKCGSIMEPEEGIFADKDDFEPKVDHTSDKRDFDDIPF